MAPVWRFEFSINCAVPRDFAWSFWTDVRNWALDADVESVSLNGPFVAGTLGHTIGRSAGLIEWRIAEVQPGRAAVLEFPAPGALAVFIWTFADSAAGSEICQEANLSGPDAQATSKASDAHSNKAYQQACASYAKQWRLRIQGFRPTKEKATASRSLFH